MIILHSNYIKKAKYQWSSYPSTNMKHINKMYSRWQVKHEDEMKRDVEAGGMIQTEKVDQWLHDGIILKAIHK